MSYADSLMKTTAAAYDRFCQERFSLPDEAAISDLEKRINVAFPSDYRRFLLDFNGGIFTEPQIIAATPGCPIDRLTFMHGLGATHPTVELGRKRDLAIFDDNDPPQIVPIGYTIMGAFILLVVHPDGSGRILLKKAFGDSFLLASGIDEFFGLLQEPLYD
jgi:hypothetical protein